MHLILLTLMTISIATADLNQTVNFSENSSVLVSPSVPNQGG